MDVDHDIIDNKHGFGEDFLEQLAKDYQWSSLLDGADASPSEILADATPLLIPPISPILSVKSSPSSSLSDSGSEDDSKNSSSSASARQSSQSPSDWMCGFDEPSYDLKPEDVELFLQKSVPETDIQQEPKKSNLVRKGPVVSIENGVIEGIKFKTKNCDRFIPQSPKASGYMQNSYFKVENEHSSLNLNIKEEKPVTSQNIKIIDSKTIPSILKRSHATSLHPPIKILDSTNERNISQSPLPQTNGIIDSNRVSPPMSNIVINAANTQHTSPVQSFVIPKSEIIEGLDVSNCSDAEIRAIKKQQRMIKNRESACQSRQKKKEYVSTLEQQLLEAQQEIVRLRLENKMLRDQLDSGGRGRKIPRLDTSLFIPKKNIAVLFAMVFMVSLNFNVLGWNSKPFVGPSMPRSNTRHLLWTEENAVSIETEEITNATYGSDCQNATKAIDVGINQTESIRIAGELKRWIGSGKNVNWTYNVPRRKQVSLNEEKINSGLLESYRLYNKLSLVETLVEIPSTKNQRNIRDKTRIRRLRRKDIDFPENDVIDYATLYRKPLRQPDEFIDDLGEWDALLQALHRRDDTFYVVGVGKGEHLLLPAVSHNITRPPKMALILPARSGNDSALNGHVTLMQIDCSVVNTTIVQLKSDALPESLRKNSDYVKAPAFNNPKLNKNNKDTVRPSLPILQNTSENKMNYSNDSQPTKNSDKGQENIFASYMFTKNDKKLKRNDTVGRKQNGTKSQRPLV